MKALGILTGFISCGLTGLVVSFFGGSFGANFLYAGIFGALFALIFFKSEILNGGDFVFEGANAKILMSNSWVYWTSNFLTAIGLSAWYKTGFWGVFVSGGISLITTMLVVALFSGLINKKS